jgi:acetyl-CoA carboxylase carboxyl transferase subunit alpha
VISPESCSSILWRSWDFKEQAAEVLKLTAKDMLTHKLIDGIVKEPLGGAHVDVKWMSDQMKRTILEQTKELLKVTPEERIENVSRSFARWALLKNSGSFRNPAVSRRMVTSGIST